MPLGALAAGWVEGSTTVLSVLVTCAWRGKLTQRSSSATIIRLILRSDIVASENCYKQERFMETLRLPISGRTYKGHSNGDRLIPLPPYYTHTIVLLLDRPVYHHYYLNIAL